MDFQESRTYNNLKAAYDDELRSSAAYRIFSDTATSEGYIEISNIFNITSRNNKEHARIWLRQINEGTLPNTLQSLQEASIFEKDISSQKYQEYARIAIEEGYQDIARLFNGISNIDYNHSTRFQRLAEEIEREEVFCKPVETLWICMECGNIMAGECAPEICPVCGFPQGYYRTLNSNIDY